MNETDFASDENIHEIFGTLVNELAIVHRCSFEEAFEIVHGEIKREYDRRVEARRAAFKVIET